jgi:hypothetical protein
VDKGLCRDSDRSPFFEIALVFAFLDHVASGIVKFRLSAIRLDYDNVPIQEPAKPRNRRGQNSIRLL